MSEIKQCIDALSNITINTLSKTPVVYGIENAVSSIRGTPARLIFTIQVSNHE